MQRIDRLRTLTKQEIQKVVKTDDVYEIEKILKTRNAVVKSNTSLSGKVIRKISTVGWRRCSNHE